MSLSRCSPRKSQRCSKSPNPPFRHGSRRRPRMSVDPDGLASSSSTSQTIGGGMKFGTIGAGEVVAALAPGARLGKAFNSIVPARFNEGPVKNGGRRVIFVSGDHPEPTAFIKQLVESFGFTAIDLGDLTTGGRLQQAGGPLAGRDLVEFGHH